MSVEKYEVDRRKFVDYLHLTFIQTSSYRCSASLLASGAPAAPPSLVARSSLLSPGGAAPLRLALLARSPPGRPRHRLPSSPVPRSSVQAAPRPFGSVGGEAAEGDGYPQGETVPSGRWSVLGELGDAAQPVADRIRVDEQQPGGGLQGGALLQVGGKGVEQRVTAADQGFVDIADQRGPGVGVAVQGALGQQLVRPGRPGRLRPGGGGAQRGQRGACGHRGGPQIADQR